jgi:hypothetical protein
VRFRGSGRWFNHAKATLMPQLSPAEIRLNKSIAALTGWANTVDRSARGRHMQAGLFAKFLREADPNNELPEHVRRAKATTLYKLHYKRMAQRSMQSRRKRLEAQQQAADELKAKRGSRSRGGAV